MYRPSNTPNRACDRPTSSARCPLETGRQPAYSGGCYILPISIPRNLLRSHRLIQVNAQAARPWPPLHKGGTSKNTIISTPVIKLDPGTRVRITAFAEVVNGQSEGSLVIPACRSHGCDLILMASHGRRGLAKLLLGSQATKVLTMSSVPVLICR